MFMVVNLLGLDQLDQVKQTLLQAQRYAHCSLPSIVVV